MSTTAVPQRPAFLDGPLQLYIGGQRVSTDERLATVNPATGETLAEVPVASPAEVDQAVRAAADAFGGWRATPPTQRARLLWALADLIEEPRGDAIMAMHEDLAAFSESSDALTCSYLTPTHRATAVRIREFMLAAGLRVHTDAVGNVVGSSPGIAVARIAVRRGPGFTSITRMFEVLRVSAA